jgi:general secretion pathway protein I
MLARIVTGVNWIARARQPGFTLLEVLVAFVIAALAMGVLLSMAGSSLRAVEVAGRYQEAISRARSHLVAIGAGGATLIPEVQQGDDGGGFRWALQVAEVAMGAVPKASPAASLTSTQAVRPALYRITVSESWADGEHTRTVRLQTERVGAAQ